MKGRERKQHIVFSEKQDDIKRRRGTRASRGSGRYAVVPLDFTTRCADHRYAAHALAEHYGVQVRTIQRWAERMSVEVWTPRGDSKRETEFDPRRDRDLLVTAMKAFGR